ncbi:MAG: rRNA adenine N-6-methyltransferase family protein [Stappiaceae bacterium]
MKKSDIAGARRWYAEDLRILAPIVSNPALVSAFENVRREDFIGPGPWQIHPSRVMASPYQVSGEDPSVLYHNVLVTLAGDRGINNGQPSLWGYLLDQIAWREGMRVCQIGAGTGYYSAIVAELIGENGYLVAIEFEKDLAARATANLADWPTIEVLNEDGTTFDPGKVDLIVVFAGATHPVDLWLDSLSPGGVLMMPMTGQDGWGAFLKIQRNGADYQTTSLGNCGFVSCAGARDPVFARRISKARGTVDFSCGREFVLHRGRPEGAKHVLLEGPNFWLSPV